MFWNKSKKEDHSFEDLNKFFQILETRVSKLENAVDNLALKIRKKFYIDPIEDEKNKKDDFFGGVLAPDPTGKGLNPK